VIVRKRLADDMDACTRLAEFVHQADGYPPYLPGPLSEFIQSRDSIAAWIAQEGGNLVGHVALHTKSSDAVMKLASEIADLPRDRFGIVARLLVSPTARHQGVGRTLLRTAERYARELGLQPILDVAAQFQAAIQLYEACGWTKAGMVTVRFPDKTNLDEYLYFAPNANAVTNNP
jgi:GNAT superfamily N-acetyltransferase